MYKVLLDMQIAQWGVDIYNFFMGFLQSLLTESPQTFLGGTLWNVVTIIHDAMIPVGEALIVTCFLISIFSSTTNIKELKSWEHVLSLVFRFAVAQGLVVASLDIVSWISDIAQVVTKTISSAAGVDTKITFEIPANVVTAAGQMGFGVAQWQEYWFNMVLSIIFFLVCVASAVALVLIVYARFFKIFMFVAFSPVPIATFAGGDTQLSQISKKYLLSFLGVCMQAALIMLAFIVYQTYASVQPAILPDAGSAANGAIVTFWLVRTSFMQILLVVLVKGSDQLVKLMGM